MKDESGYWTEKTRKDLHDLIRREAEKVVEKSYNHHIDNYKRFPPGFANPDVWLPDKELAERVTSEESVIEALVEHVKCIIDDVTTPVKRRVRDERQHEEDIEQTNRNLSHPSRFV